MSAGEVLLERERELEAIDTLIEEARARSPRIAVLEGGPGIGKSRLLAAARERAAGRGFRALSARCTELERPYAYGAVRQLFEPLRADPATWDAIFAGAAASARPVFESPGDVESVGDLHDASFATLHGLYWVTVNLGAREPLLLVVDDLQWCDRPSLRFLAYLAPRMEGLAALLAAGLRSGEAVTDPALLADIAGGPSVFTLQPGPLSPAGVTRLLAERLGGPADPCFAAACMEATGGNPLLLGQLISSLASEGVRPRADEVEVVRAIGPRAVSRTILLRLARLDTDAVATAGAIAVLGESATLPTVSALCDLPEDTVARALAGLARIDLVRRDPPLGFVHPLVREAIYGELPPGERDLLHGRAARVLERAGAPPGSVAMQLLKTPPGRGDRWVAEVLRSAGHDAMRRGATEVAVTHLRRALDEPPEPALRGDLLFELGVAETDSSGPDALAHLMDAYEVLEDPRRRAPAALRVARLLMHTGPGEATDATSFARRAAADLPEDLTDERLAFEALETTSRYWGAASPVSPEIARRHRAGVPDTGPGARMAMGAAALDWALTGGPADACAALAERSLSGDASIDFVNASAAAMAAVALELAERDVYSVWDAWMADAHRRGSLFGALSVHLWRGWTLLRHGALPEAEQSLRDAAAEEALWGVPGSQTYSPSFLGLTLIEQGRLEAAREVLDAVPDEAVPTYGGEHLRRARVELLLAEGDWEAALAAAEAGERALPFITNPASVPWKTLQAQALDGLGRVEDALARAAQELEAAYRWGAPGTVGRALRVLGTIRRAEGLADLEEAVAQLERSSARLELAKALAALGASLRRAGRQADARAPLRRAFELASACRTESLVEHIRTELAAAGARPRTAALTGLEALTPSERRVASLAAGGQTNREIAQTLYVTPKTVEVHLSNTYRKLGIRSRRELGTALASAPAPVV